MTETTGPNGCDAVLNIRGEHFWCDERTPHLGLAHISPDAEAIWFGKGEAKEAEAAWKSADPENAR